MILCCYTRGLLTAATNSPYLFCLFVCFFIKRDVLLVYYLWQTAKAQIANEYA